MLATRHMERHMDVSYCDQTSFLLTNHVYLQTTCTPITATRGLAGASNTQRAGTIAGVSSGRASLVHLEGDIRNLSGAASLPPPVVP